MKPRLSRNLAQKKGAAEGATSEPVHEHAASIRRISYIRAKPAQRDLGLGARLPHRIHSACIIQWRRSMQCRHGRRTYKYIRGILSRRPPPQARTERQEPHARAVYRGHELLCRPSEQAEESGPAMAARANAASDQRHRQRALCARMDTIMHGPYIHRVPVA